MFDKITLEILSKLSTEDWMAILFFISLCLCGIATFLFSRITVRHIEGEMGKEGILPPEWDKGIGVRMIAYAGIIVFPKLKRNASLVNVEATKSYCRTKDTKLAWFYMIVTLSTSTSTSTLILIFAIAYLYGPDS